MTHTPLVSCCLSAINSISMINCMSKHKADVALIKKEKTNENPAMEILQNLFDSKIYMDKMPSIMAQHKYMCVCT